MGIKKRPREKFSPSQKFFIARKRVSLVSDEYRLLEESHLHYGCNVSGEDFFTEEEVRGFDHEPLPHVGVIGMGGDAVERHCQSEFFGRRERSRGLDVLIEISVFQNLKHCPCEFTADRFAMAGNATFCPKVKVRGVLRN